MLPAVCAVGRIVASAEAREIASAGYSCSTNLALTVGPRVRCAAVGPLPADRIPGDKESLSLPSKFRLFQVQRESSRPHGKAQQSSTAYDAGDGGAGVSTLNLRRVSPANRSPHANERIRIPGGRSIMGTTAAGRTAAAIWNCTDGALGVAISTDSRRIQLLDQKPSSRSGSGRLANVPEAQPAHRLLTRLERARRQLGTCQFLRLGV